MSTRRALAFSFIDRYASLVLNIGASMIIARLLTPTEIGVFSVTMVMLIALTSLRDLGAGQYLIQERELTPERIRAAWSVSLGTGVLAALVVLIAAKPVAVFYNEPRMTPIMLVIALNFALNPFGSLTYAWLMREMRFDALAWMRFLSGVVGAVASVYFAWTGWGPIGLAFGSLLTTVTNGVVASFLRPRHFPLRPGLTGLRRVVDAGSKFSANGLFSVLGGTAAEVLLGKLQSLANAAMYSRANGLGTMFQRLVLDATQVVAIPMFAREAREQADMGASFIRTVAYTTALGWAFFAGLALLAHPSIRLLYGLQWDAAVTATRIVALAYMVGIPAAMCPAVLMATGAAGLMVKVTALTVVVQIIAMAIGASVSLDATAWALAASSTFGVVAWLTATRRSLGYRRRELLAALARSGAVAAITALGPLAVGWHYGWHPEALAGPLLWGAGSGSCLFALAVFACRHPLREEIVKLLRLSGMTSR